MRRLQISDEIIGTLRDVSGHTFDTLYDLYFTKDRIIAVLIRNPGDVLPSTTWISILFTGYFSRRAEENKKDEIAAERRLRAKNLSPDALLARSNRNFQIKNEIIESIRIKKDLLGRYYIIFQLIIAEHHRNIKFSMDKEHADEANALFQKLYPDKFKLNKPRSKR